MAVPEASHPHESCIMRPAPGVRTQDWDLSALSVRAGATVTGGEMTVHGCGRDSVQGDVRCAFAQHQESPGSGSGAGHLQLGVLQPCQPPQRGSSVARL